MRYHITANTDVGAVCLKRDTLEGAFKKANELRRDGTYLDVHVVDTETGDVLQDVAPQNG